MPTAGLTTRGGPPDRRGQGAGRSVDLYQVVQAPVVRFEGRPRPVRPEVAQIGADRRRPAVNQLLEQAQGVERLVPELALGSARTRSGAARATVCAIRLPMS